MNQLNILKKNLAFLGYSEPLPEKFTLDLLEELSGTSGHDLVDLLCFDLSSSTYAWKDLRFVFLDVDGVMTEGGMFYTDSGDEFKRFDTKDGMAIKVAMKHGIQFGIISSGVNRKIIQHRADMFGIEHVYVGTEPKLGIAEQWLEKMNINWSETAYIGDDINDLRMFKKVAIAACPSDATLPIKKAASFVLNAPGGHGCIRTFLRHHPELKSLL